MKGKKFLAIVGIFSLAALSFGLAAIGATSADVTATVTPQNISVTVSPGSASYGTLSLSTSDASRTTALSGAFTATNNGNTSETFTIKGSDATAVSEITWTLNDAPDATGTVASNQYVHRYDNTTGGVFNTGEARALNSSSYKALAAGVAASGTADFVLQMNMPTATTGLSQRSSTVTILATAP